MPSLTLSEEERAFLLELLDDAYKARLHEIHHTDRRAFRNAVREQAELIDRLARRLEAIGPRDAPRTA